MSRVTGFRRIPSRTFREAEREEALDALDALVTSSEDPAMIAQAILAAATSSVACSGGAILLATPVREEYDVLASVDAPAHAPGSRRALTCDTMAGALVVSLRACGVEFGRLLLFDAGDPGSAGRAALQRLARTAAIIHPLRQAEALRTQVTETTAIVEVGQVLTGLLAMDDVLSYVVYLAESLVRGNSATIALVSPETGELILKTSTGTLRSVEGSSIPIEGSLMGWVVRHGQPVVTPNVSDDPRGHRIGAPQGPGIVVPVQINGRTIGAFLVARKVGSEAFTEQNLETLQKMAVYAAIAIQNAQSYREQMDTADTLRKQAGELQDAYTELNRRQEQLIVSEKMAALGRITAGIAHEINSPLGGILNSIRTAKAYVNEYRASAGDPEITVEDHHGIASDILGSLSLAEAAAATVAQFVRSIKTQTRAGENQVTTFDPAAQIDATVVLLQHRLKIDQIAVFTRLQRGLEIHGDQGEFCVVMQNLIANAIDAYEGRPGEIWVRLSGRQGLAYIEVQDRGAGIPEAIRNRIYDYLFTTKDVGKGTGLGLAMVHSVVTASFGGEIAFESEPGRGTTFKVSLPLHRGEE